MKRQAKASSAGSTSAIGNGRNLISRTFAIGGAPGDRIGSGAPPRRFRLAILALTVSALLVSPTQALAGPVNITLTGAGEGTVTSSSPTGMDCSRSGGTTTGTCSIAVIDDFSFTPTTLIATPSPGSIFSGWTVGRDECMGTASPCKLILTTFFETYDLTATFEPPPDPPSATTDPASAGLNDTLALLKGRVNPNGSELTSCRFAYGLTSDYGSTTACDQSIGIGSGTTEVPVSASTEPLDPGATYHFRLFASNLGGTVKGKDRTFTTPPGPSDTCPNAGIRAEQGAKALNLPDCMALEMVSPPKKGQQYAIGPSISASGGRVLFNSIAALADTPDRLSAFGDDYVATRGASGWTTQPTTPPPPIFQPSGTVEATGFTPEFSRWFHIGGTQDQSPMGINQAFQAGLGGVFSPISPLLRPLSGTGGSKFVGSSADHSHVFLKAGLQRKTTSYLAGDPQPNGTGIDRNVYVAMLGQGGQPTVELLARDLNGKVWGGNCGARLGGMEATSGGELVLPNGERNQGAISPDGSRVYFSTRPAQPSGEPCSAPNKERIMERVETPAGPAISELFGAECDRVSPPCSSVDSDDLYEGASLDQTKVYFTTTRQLAGTDLDSNGNSCVSSISERFTAVVGCDLYLYDSTMPAGERLTQVSAGDASAPTPGEGATVASGIAGISADGSHVYFAAAGVLTTDPNPEGDVAEAGKPNFYAWDAATRSTKFIGTLATGPSLLENDGGFIGSGLWGDDGTWSNGAFPVPVGGIGNDTGGDGHILLFGSKAPLAAMDSDGGKLDLYRYDTSAEPPTLVCISCRPGGPDSEPFEATRSRGRSVGTDYADRARWASEDGQTIVFSTVEAMLPGDVNGALDAYMWREGQIFRLPGVARVSLNPTVSRDGATVAFTSKNSLLPFDADSVEDVYVARVGGGYRNPPAPATCEGEACQGAAGTISNSIDAATSSFNGRGNLNADSQKPQCARGKIRKRGKCVKAKKPHKKGKRHRRGGSK